MAVDRLLESCPQLTILATSREPLGSPPSNDFGLPRSPCPTQPMPASLDHSPAVAVFIDHATRLDPTWRPSVSDLATITEIVRRLDGLPLAIELAAGRLATLGLEDLHARLDHALDLLGDEPGTLRQTIAWSYDLLRDDEQRLARFIRRFPTGSTSAAAEALRAKLT